MPTESIFLQIRVEEEKNLLTYLQDRINSPVIQKLLSVKDQHLYGDVVASYLKGYSLLLSEKIGKEIFRKCKKVQDMLGFADMKIQFYIANNPQINAYSVFNVNYSEDDPHCIILNSGLLDKLDETELVFVIGHEMGHLFYEHSHLKRVIQFIYPDENRMPGLLSNLYNLWLKLSEISADRIGLMATRAVEPAVSAMFRLSSGLSSNVLPFAYKEFMMSIDGALEDVSRSPMDSRHSHPAFPIRIQALRLFCASQTYEDMVNDREVKEDNTLVEEMNKLVSFLKKYPSHDTERAELDFLASAGFYLMNCDEKVEEAEIDHLVNLLSQYLFYPQPYIKKLIEGNTVKDTLVKSASHIVERNPQRARNLFLAILPLMMRDQKLDTKEVETALEIGAKYLKIPFDEVIDLALNGIRDLYSPFS